MRAFIYIRVSTVDQEYSPEAQEQQARFYCASRGYEVAHVFNEPAISGSKPLAKRAQGAELIARIGEVDAIVFAKLDRAFRDTVDCILTVEQLGAAGKTVHFLDLGIDTSTPAGELCMSMMAAFAKFERRRISERTKEALAVARERGVQLGRPEKVLSLDEARAARYAKVLRDGGETYQTIAQMLEAQGHLTPSGSPHWSHSQVSRLIERCA
jgi:DNA invertase Pin-like site-specific DNA recombinase